MRHIITKLTKEQLKTTLHKSIKDCTENEIRFIFNVFDLTLKEFYKKEGLVDFEIHFKRNYLMRLVAKGSLIHFNNEYVNFQADDDSTNGVSMPCPENIMDVVIIFINMFTPNILKNAGYELSFNSETSIFDSIEEVQEYMELIQAEAQKSNERREEVGK